MAYRIGGRTNTMRRRTSGEPRSTYEQAFTPFKSNPSKNVKINPPIKVLGEMEIPPAGYFIDHKNPTDNIIYREVPNPIFDHSDVNELESDEIYELLPKPPTYPDTPPQNIDLFVANWSRIYNFGGLTDPDKDVRIDDVTDWSIGQWATRHRWPAEVTLDPTYIFFTQDPALFYTQRAISHYEPDEKGDMKAIMVDDSEVVWKLDGKEVHRGWYMDLSALSRTVQVIQGEAAIVPRLLSVEAHNEQGMLRKELKFAAIDSDDGGLIGGANQIDNFSSTFEGQFIADDDDNSENYRTAIFWPDPRYGPRTIYLRFIFDGFGKGKSRRRKFRKATGTFKVDGQTKLRMSGTQFQDKWQRKDWRLKSHQDAMKDFPQIFNNSGKVRSKYKNERGGKLDEINVTDWTEGRRSALFFDEPSRGFNRLLKFEKKPGPFDLSMAIGFKVRSKGWFSKRVMRRWNKTLSYIDGELNLDTPLQPIDLGVVHIGYKND